MKDGFTRYSTPQGLPDLRERIAQKLVEENSIKAHPDDIVVTPGARNAIYSVTAALLKPGDEVIVINPCWVSYNPIALLAEPNVIIHNVNMTQTYSLNYQAIREAVNVRTKLIIVNYPNNPTGKMLDSEEIGFINRLMMDNPSLYLLSDEIYDKLIIGSYEHFSPASRQEIAHRVITVNGFSKTYAMTGWRIGYLHTIDKDLRTTITKVNQQLNTNTAVFIQKAAIAALDGPHDHLEQMIENLKIRRKMFLQMLEDNPYLTGPIPEGGIFAFVNIAHTGFGSDEFCARLLEDTGVAMIPGVSFGTGYDDHVRISLVNQTSEIEKGLQLFNDFVYKWSRING